MFPIGQIIGGIIATYVLGLLFDWMIFKRLSISRPVGLALSAITAIIVGVILYGFGNADGGPWNPGNGYVAYGIGGFIAGVIRYWRADSRGEFIGKDGI